MPKLHTVTITIKRIDDGALDQVQTNVISKLKEAGLKPDVKITNLGTATTLKKTNG